MIEAHGLSKHYGRTRAVDSLSFRVRSGVVTGFLGPNGSGKSTTMRMILGLDRPDAGQVTLAGPITTSGGHFTKWGQCWRPRRCILGDRPTTTCSAWPSPMPSRRRSSTRSSGSSD